MQELRIDPEFERIIPPLTADEFQLLKENILAEGKVRDALITWNGIILDGHNRYRIVCEYPEIPFATEERNFADREEAIWWMCKNQLGRRNLTEYQRRALIGRRYKAEKRTNGSKDSFRGNQYTGSLVLAKNLPVPENLSTAERIGKEYGISHASVKNAESLVDGLDAAEEELPGITKDILSGMIKPSQKDVIAVGKEKDAQRRHIRAENLRRAKNDKIPLPSEETVSEEHQNDEANEPEFAEESSIEDDTLPELTPAETRALYKSIEAISADMAKPKEALTLDDVLVSIDGAVNSFQNNCDFFFRKYPGLLREDGCREKTMRIINRLKKYIKKIEGEKYL
ncbi:MAG: hypothetical protein K6F76_03540 [Clostridiales bacterium]|nr:hypothetical protein [Clostridiales bacterium]